MKKSKSLIILCFALFAFTRTRNLDDIPFKSLFKYDLEMLSWNGGTIDAAATVYWYGAAGAEAE